MTALPEGTVTFLFSDVEGSTQLLERHGDLMGNALARHHELFEQIVDRHDGVIFETVGDAVYAAFATPSAAIAASLVAHRTLASEPWGPVGRMAVRIAINTGPVQRRGDHYFGPALFRAARLQALGYGEQTLVSGVTSALAAGGLPDGAELLDLGFHRLKDLGEPEHVFQLVHPDLRRDFPPLKALDAHRHNLPEQLSSFIGRDQELVEVGRLVDANRLVTLLGPGGIGKTRLALQVAADRFEAHSDGVWFVDLAPIEDAALVPGTVAQALGLPGDPGGDVGGRLRTFLAASDLLLVLDNLEQLRDAAAPLVSGWLQVAPRIRILATSRAPLRIRGEHEYDVPSLNAGDPAAMEAQPAPAVALFVERARAIRPDFNADEATGPLIAGICARLDGLPLAIELAAARLRLFPLPELDRRLSERLPLLVGGARDAPARQQTLEATIAWSETLLGTPERMLFRRLGAFAGGFTYDAAGAIADPSDRDRLPELLGELIEQSLIKGQAESEPPRYQMLETIREFARARLRDTSELDETMGRMAGYLSAVCEDVGPQVIGGGQLMAMAKLDGELENMRLVLAWLRNRGDAEQFVRMVISLSRYWLFRGLLSEGRGWLATARQLYADDSSRLAADLVAAAAMLAGNEDPALALSLSREAADRYRALGLELELARALGSEVLALQEHLDWGEADRIAMEALAIAERTGDLRTQALARGNLAIAKIARGEPEGAEALFMEVVALLQDLGDEHGVVIGLGNLAALKFRRQDLDGAERYLRQALDASRTWGFPGLEGWALAGVAEILERRGRVTDAARMMDEGLGLLAHARDLPVLVRSFDGAGLILASAGDPHGAVVTWATTERLAAKLHVRRDASAAHDQAEEAVRAVLGQAAVAAATGEDVVLGIDAACLAIRARLRHVVDSAQSDAGPDL